MSSRRYYWANHNCPSWTGRPITFVPKPAYETVLSFTADYSTNHQSSMRSKLTNQQSSRADQSANHKSHLLRCHSLCACSFSLGRRRPHTRKATQAMSVRRPPATMVTARARWRGEGGAATRFRPGRVASGRV
jgi:hypothetical protein